MSSSREPIVAVVYLDIDDTLINFSLSTSSVQWNSSLYLWRRFMAELVESGRKSNITIHFGIATFKKLYASPNRELSGFCGDSISDVILENDCDGTNKQIKPGCGLKDFIHPQLIFFTGNQCKLIHALQRTNLALGTDDSSAILNKDIFIIDDSIMVTAQANANGYTGICVGNLSQLQTNMQDASVADAFKAIFEKLGLQPSDYLLRMAAMLNQSKPNLFAPKNAAAFLKKLANDSEQAVMSLDDEETSAEVSSLGGPNL